ncbi:MAG: hypothetical protein IJO32_00845 [Bacilli bacterium]|nr:hypothetical protein [Bacilli bacterium]
MHIIENGYKNHDGIYYDNIRNVHYDKKNDTINNLGLCVNQTEYKENDPFAPSFSDELGVYIYKSYYDKNKALRLYKDYGNYKFVFHNDEKLISELQRRQKNIKLTDFPTGIISIEDYTVGQEIVYYENFNTLLNVIKNKDIKDNIFDIYLEMLKILKELYINGIVYSDIHYKNFMVDSKLTIKLIDFEPRYVKFDENSKYLYETMIRNLKNTINSINLLYNIKFNNNFNNTTTLEQVEESIMEKQYLLKK